MAYLGRVCSNCKKNTNNLIHPKHCVCPLRGSDHSVIDRYVLTFLIISVNPYSCVECSSSFTMRYISSSVYKSISPSTYLLLTHYSGRPSTLVLYSHLLSTQPSSSPQGGLFMLGLAAHTPFTAGWEALTHPAPSRHAGHAERPHHRASSRQRSRKICILKNRIMLYKSLRNQMKMKVHQNERLIEDNSVTFLPLMLFS